MCGQQYDVIRQSNGLATVKFTQPVVVHKLDDEYDLPCGRLSKTPAAAVQVLGRDDGGGTIDNIEATVYHSGTDICMFIMQCNGLDWTFTMGQKDWPGIYICTKFGGSSKGFEELDGIHRGNKNEGWS